MGKSEKIKENNFNLIRLYLSLSVLFYHAAELSREKDLNFLTRWFNVDKAVQAFFIISGYLIIKSYRRSSGNAEFFLKRVKRIYPAYILLIMASAFLGVFASSYPAMTYFRSPLLYRYIAANSIFLNFIQPDLPGVFEKNTFQAVDGSLWTLKIEIGYYLIVPLLVYLGSKWKPHFLYGLLFLLSLGWYFGMLRLYHIYHKDAFLFLSRQLPGQLFYFIIGAWVAGIDRLPLFRRILTGLALPCLIASFFSLGIAGNALVLGVTVFFFAYIVPAVQYPLRREDISYGLYIYHFPVIQVLVWCGTYGHSPLAGLAWSLVITVVLAFLSWFFIEKPFLMKQVLPTIIP